ncbi:NAD-glutamate dehydrogenase [Motiliproteus sp. MSK22-1]|uniref:NAD-glutamate dehydrogenase n=1 Tax=Motiliproteus sp. MSK22-1 TaxID=1897630 RepID=UPI000978B4F3|nr:NAD-glutamate dehydrogenase [Motiliproteus sp. MSK22-1]OMH32848.1 NAD-glutamate dehydrogenase [Motiliproteus sp. MSK22-1]
MHMLSRKGHAEILSKLEEELNRQLAAKQAKQVLDFARLHYGSSSGEEIAGRRLDELYGATMECWHFFQHLAPDQPKVKVFNPDFEENGWQSTHTVIVILQTDMPFLIDSVRMEVNRRELTIHSIHNSIMAVKRDPKGNLQEVTLSEGTEEEVPRESIIYLEVDRHTDPTQLKDLRRTLVDILNEVTLVTSDFIKMRSKATSLKNMINGISDKLTKVDAKEMTDFVNWLEGDHFTFLGYEAYKAKKKGSKVVLEPVSGSELGMFRCCDEKSLHMQVSDLPTGQRDKIKIGELLSFTKSPTKSRIHRPAYSDYIAVKCFDAKGKLSGEHRFLGLYTSSVYYQSTTSIPVVRRKVDAVLRRAGLHRGSHDWKELEQILEIYPRDDLFQVSTDELFETALGILHIHERRRTRVFIRRDLYGRYYSCLVYTPRDAYSTDYRIRVQEILCEELGSSKVEFNTHFSESILARTQFILHVDQDGVDSNIDPKAIEQRIIQASRSWQDDLYNALIDFHGEEEGIGLANQFRSAFPASYRDDFPPRTAVADIQHMKELDDRQPMAMSFYRELEQPIQQVNFKLFHYGEPIPLSDVIPIMENLGLKVMDDHPYAVRSGEACYWIHDFRMLHRAGSEIDMQSVRETFQNAFAHIWYGDAESDRFNRLVLGAQLGWREVAMLRAYAAYIKQLKFGISQRAIANCLIHHVGIAKKLIALFNARFEPEGKLLQKQESLKESIIEDLESVPSLTDDRIIRRYLDIILATLRTNFFQKGDDGKLKPYFSFKFSPRDIPDIPHPRPMFEIFVYSPRVQGVHLRGGKVARGGLRWSDRNEDFRTEVLGLVKAQQVKNAVIVPVGAKGGFVAKRLRDSMSREKLMAEGIECYKLFIRGLLDITDNLKDDLVVPPPQVYRHDTDDTYLVVAADKGTATFSDIANGIAKEYDFWLGDAFASGGSQGYDHKGMGITARGAWVSVERHFRELGHNTATTDFTVLAIGDMAGDVFGNGMLRSEHIRLVAAFNHLHIFIDPEPDAAISFKERQRLFDLPRSSWLDYDDSLISKGGGVFSRSAKSIPISTEMQSRFNISANRMTPNALLHAILQAPVDLLWNGGIGTYVKSSDETHNEVGDKANDAIRVDADQLSCRVIGEGGNLGITQRARLEYCLKGGACNTDFIDNAGGVDCSDHEVNIKILLDAIVEAGDLTIKHRNQFLKEMTDSVAELVLGNNYRQVQAISLAEAQTLNKMGEFRRLISHLEDEGKLNRELEFIPSDDELTERRINGKGLTRAELSVIISYCKAQMKEEFIASDLPEDEHASRELETAFPAELVSRYQSEIYQHRLKREIISTQIANHMVNQMGISYVQRLQLSTGSKLPEIAKSYILARDVFQLPQLWSQIEALDNKVGSEVQAKMMLELQRLVRRASRWFLRNRRMELNVQQEVENFAPQVKILSEAMGEWLQGSPAQNWRDRYYYYHQSGVPEDLASVVAGTDSLYMSLGVIEVARDTEANLAHVVEAYCVLGERLDLYWFAKRVSALTVDNHWQALAREAFRDDLDWQVRALATSLIKRWNGKDSISDCFDLWMQQYDLMVLRWLNMLSDLKGADKQDYSMFTVAIRELFDLAKGTMLSEGG